MLRLLTEVEMYIKGYTTTFKSRWMMNNLNCYVSKKKKKKKKKKEKGKK